MGSEIRDITTQAELDAAGSEWVRCRMGRFVASGSAHVVAQGSAHVEAWDSAHVVAWDSAHVEAWDSAHVVAYDSAHVVAYDSAHVVASGSAHVVASGSAHVVAQVSAHVEAWDSAHVEASGSAHVVAQGSAHVEAWDSAHVEAVDFASIVRRSIHAKIVTHGQAIAIVPEYPGDVTAWAALKGIPVTDGRMCLWKAVRADGTDFKTGRISYLGEAVAPDWDGNYPDECGAGLHLSDSRSGARYFVPSEHRDTFRLFEVSVAVEDCRCFAGRPDYPMKLRARACRFVREVPREEM